MSATIETNTSGWRKRFRDLTQDESGYDGKRCRYYYYRLESESSRASAEEDTESVCSVQDRETDVVRDTTDTDSKSETSADEYEVEIEYEVASLSGDDNIENYLTNSSSGSEDMMLAAVAGAICENSLEAWITDCEDSDSSIDETSFGRSDFSRCVQCKSANDNPLYRYCEKCYQDRKRFFPPRPRRNRRSKKSPSTGSSANHPVKLDTLRSCLSGLSSQDSGIGSSQECPQLDLDQIVVPIHLQAGTSQIASQKALDTERSDSGIETPLTGSSSFESVGTSVSGSISRKRQYSESSLSDLDVVERPRRKKFASDDDLKGDFQNLPSSSEASSSSELCIFCNNAPKDSIFLHTNIAHRCCCYKCAKRTLHTIKRCPICNRAVNKVVKIYTS